MLMFAGLAALAAGASAGTDVEVLEQLWPGSHDSSEQTVINTDRGVVGWTEGVEHRVRTIVSRVKVPSLGAHVLYLEEFLQDEPDELRRQILLQLEPQGPPEAAVRVHLFSFVKPAQWTHLDRRKKLAETVQRSDLLPSTGCDLVLTRDGTQFMGGTIGHDCSDPRMGADRYVDYQLVIGEELYWYHRRVLHQRNDQLSEEVMGYNWFELNAAQLFTCRIDWSATGEAADLKPLQRLEVRDEGGRARFSTPDGRMFELILHSQDWPFIGERDALILMIQEQGAASPLSSAWSEIESQQISLQMDWLRVRCGPLVPDTDELIGALSERAFRYPAGAGG